jgi:hypothetical protein
MHVAVGRIVRRDVSRDIELAAEFRPYQAVNRISHRLPAATGDTLAGTALRSVGRLDVFSAGSCSRKGGGYREITVDVGDRYLPMRPRQPSHRRMQRCPKSTGSQYITGQPPTMHWMSCDLHSPTAASD